MNVLIVHCPFYSVGFIQYIIHFINKIYNINDLK